jgi:hypothetical protein
VEICIRGQEVQGAAHRPRPHEQAVRQGPVNRARDGVGLPDADRERSRRRDLGGDHPLEPHLTAYPLKS